MLYTFWTIPRRWRRRITWVWMAIMLSTVSLLGQEPAQYQVIKVRFKVLSRDGEVLPRASLAARLDSSSARVPPDKTLKAGLGRDEYSYSTDDSTFSVFSSEQISNEEGALEVPFVVYKNRPDSIDYELACFYQNDRINRLYPHGRKRAISYSDAGSLVTLTVDALPPLTLPRLLLVIAAWLGATIMGALLFFRGVYRSLLAQGRPIDLSRALCWSGLLFVSLTAMALLYWLSLPKILNLYVFIAFLLVIWLLHLVFTVLPKRT
jgi:hypothetical protein